MSDLPSGVALTWWAVVGAETGGAGAAGAGAGSAGAGAGGGASCCCCSLVTLARCSAAISAVT